VCGRRRAEYEHRVADWTKKPWTDRRDEADAGDFMTYRTLRLISETVQSSGMKRGVFVIYEVINLISDRPHASIRAIARL